MSLSGLQTCSCYTRKSASEAAHPPKWRSIASFVACQSPDLDLIHEVTLLQIEVCVQSGNDTGEGKKENIIGSGHKKGRNIEYTAICRDKKYMLTLALTSGVGVCRGLTALLFTPPSLFCGCCCCCCCFNVSVQDLCVDPSLFSARTSSSPASLAVTRARRRIQTPCPL